MGELIRLEMETLWGFDERGRVLRSHHLVAGVTAGGEVVVAYGADESDAVVDQLAAVVPTRTQNDGQPAFIAECQRILDKHYDTTELNSGPGYLIPDGLTFESAAEFVDSRSDDIGFLHSARPENWESQEWADLLSGQDGPWAMAIAPGQRIAAICHAPASTARAAEIGVWTDPDFRGQGLAAATTARWAQVASGRTLFYSTSADNVSSQRVAARLELPHLGWLWKLSRPGESGIHAGRRGS